MARNCRFSVISGSAAANKIHPNILTGTSTDAKAAAVIRHCGIVYLDPEIKEARIQQEVQVYCAASILNQCTIAPRSRWVRLEATRKFRPLPAASSRCSLTIEYAALVWVAQCTPACTEARLGLCSRERRATGADATLAPQSLAMVRVWSRLGHQCSPQNDTPCEVISRASH